MNKERNDSLPLLIIDDPLNNSLFSIEDILSPTQNIHASEQIEHDFFRPNILHSKISPVELDKKVESLVSDFHDVISNLKPLKLPPSRILSTTSSRSPYKQDAPDTTMKNSFDSSISDRLNEVLLVPHQSRSQTSVVMLFNMLRGTLFRSPLSNRDFSFYFQNCSNDNLNDIANQMTILETSSKNRKDENKRMADVVPKVCSIVTHCFIVLDGACTCKSISNTATVIGSNSSRNMEGDGSEVSLSVGHVLGFEALDEDICSTGYHSAATGTSTWSLTIPIDSEEKLTLCCIPLKILQECVGSFGRTAADLMRCFLQSAFIWREFVQNKIETDDNEEEGGDDAASCSSVRMQKAVLEAEHSIFSLARVKVFQPGDQIIKQGSARHFLHVILQGTCAYSRQVTTVGSTHKKESLLEVEVHGDPLLPGDFVLFDGEGSEWVQQVEQKEIQFRIKAAEMFSSRLNSPLARRLWSSPTTHQQTSNSRRSPINRSGNDPFRLANKTRFGFHKQSLIAQTRVEVCTIPIDSLVLNYDDDDEVEVRKRKNFEGRSNGHFGLLKKLATVCDSRYSYLKATDDDLLFRLKKERLWQLEKKSLIHQFRRSSPQKQPPAQRSPDLLSPRSKKLSKS